MTPTWLIGAAGAGGALAGPVLESAARRARDRRAAPRKGPLEVLAAGGGRPWTTVAAVAVGGALEVVVALRFGEHWTLAAASVFVAGFASLAWCDLLHLRLPKRLLYPTLALTWAFLLVASGLGEGWHRLAGAGAAGGVALGVFGLLNFFNPAGLAFGDVRMAAGMGTVLGWFSVPCAVEGFVLASLLGALAAAGLLLTRRANRSTALPYGVFLALGAVVALLVSGPAALG